MIQEICNKDYAMLQFRLIPNCTSGERNLISFCGLSWIAIKLERKSQLLVLFIHEVMDRERLMKAVKEIVSCAILNVTSLNISRDSFSNDSKGFKVVCEKLFIISLPQLFHQSMQSPLILLLTLSTL